MQRILDLAADGPTGPGRILEGSTGRLRESLAILEAIQEGDLLAELPKGPARARHQCAVSLLSLLERELRAIIAEQEAHLGRGVCRGCANDVVG